MMGMRIAVVLGGLVASGGFEDEDVWKWLVLWVSMLTTEGPPLKAVMVNILNVSRAIKQV
jgi:hypothetical protein